MKNKIMLLILAVLVMVMVGCGMKETKEQESVQIEIPQEKEEQYDKENERLEFLDSLLPEPNEVFKNGTLSEDSYISSDGQAYKYVYVYDEWSDEEFEAYKDKAVSVGGFTETNYDVKSDDDGRHFAARTKDDKFYFSMGRVKSEGRKCLVISVSED